EWKYIPVEIGSGAMPENFTGVVFSNEFFDALPVDVAVYKDGIFREQSVALEDGRFVWRTEERVAPEVERYLRTRFPPAEEGRWYEANLEAMAWMERIASALVSGWILTIDYGY